MKVGILGCGAIGGLFLGYLSEKNYDVIGIVKDYQKESFMKEGLVIGGLREEKKYKIETDTQLREKIDLAIFATKINDLEAIVKENIQYLPGATVVSTQNGIQADYILEKYFPKNTIITGIVMFGATFYAPNKIVHNFEGDLLLGNIFDTKVDNLEEVSKLLSSVFKTTILDNLRGAKYLKLFINLNNCIPALLGVSMQEAFSDLEVAELAIRLNKEAYGIVESSNIELASLPSYPKERLEGLVSMDIKGSAALFSKIMTSLSKEPLYGSILQSIKRGKKSEIDYINGEIVKLARGGSLQASLNERIVQLICKVESTGTFLKKQELLQQFSVQV